MPFQKWFKFSWLPNTYWKTVLYEKVLKFLTIFNSILLIYKSKFVFVLIISVIQMTFLLLFNTLALIDWNIYGISLKDVKPQDIVLLYNIFAVNMLLINIAMLVFVNQNLFIFDFDIKKLPGSLKKDYSYWISLFLVVSFTFYFILYFPFQEIVNLYYLYSPCGIKFNLFLLGEFNSRYTLLSVYKILAIYVAFGSSNRSLGYRLLMWLFLITLIKIASLNSCMIVDAMVCFLAVHPEVVNLKDYSWKLCFESIMSYLMEDRNRKMSQEEIIKNLEEENKKMKEVLDTRLANVMPIVRSTAPSLLNSNHTQQEIDDRLNHCMNKMGHNLDCLTTTSTWTSYIVESISEHYGGKFNTAEKEGKTGVKTIKRAEDFVTCIKNDNWRAEEAARVLRIQQEEASKKLEDERIADLEHWKRHS